MTRICRWLLFVALIVSIEPFSANAAYEDPNGNVQLVWKAQYIPFSWKFTVDPFFVLNGSLSMEFDGSRAQLYDPSFHTQQGLNPPFGDEPPVRPNPLFHYVITSMGQVVDFDPANPSDTRKILKNIQFSLPSDFTLAQVPEASQGMAVCIFDVFFDDLDPMATANGDTSIFRIFAGPDDGFNFPLTAMPVDPTDSLGIPDFSGNPAIPGSNIVDFARTAPVPEPGSFVLALLGALGVLSYRRRR